ncbi:diadenylate cyclase CdaA [Aliifodinibius sp. S!AR15-10]|uniref:diadenylate cyclase CdaA n=1 Tax=Aliifodinibius sp. S!AR15-10 TaxID=2950437 RepID=UPI00285F76C6|nr:diadenylate cyclase CdaA [Aliifodinibius sp. S!AR15-10]MDR8393001.1 diadenylate cyclase CdaA [Aliifodinibius sp. S!AR15-10]
MIPVGFLEFGIKDLFEVLIIAFILFYLYRWIRGSFAIQAAVGLVFIIMINALVSALGLTTINFILRSILDVGVLAVFIIFQPEIRKLLYSLGQNTNLDRFFFRSNSDTVIDEVIEAVRNMSHSKTGALIVFARSSSLQDLVDVGVKLDARVNSELLESIFNKTSPLHDGAIVIRSNRIVAASCYLPISQNPNLSSVFGTRHRAAVGITETNNVFVVVVSEETGRISVARNGSLTSGLTIQKLRAEMQQTLGEQKMDESEMTFSSTKSELNLN